MKFDIGEFIMDKQGERECYYFIAERDEKQKVYLCISFSTKTQRLVWYTRMDRQWFSQVYLERCFEKIEVKRKEQK